MTHTFHNEYARNAHNRVHRKLSKRTLFLAGPADAGQHKDAAYTVIEKAGDGAVKLMTFKVPYLSRYGPDVYAKRMAPRRYWFQSNAIAEAVPQDHLDLMEMVAMGTSDLEPFDVDLLGKLQE